MPIHSLSDLKQAYNYMCFKAFYTSIYNIHLSFIKIERKTGREEEKTKSAKKSGSSRRSDSPRRIIPSPRQSRWGQKMVLGLPRWRASPRRRGVGLKQKWGIFFPFHRKFSTKKKNQIQNKLQNPTQTNQKHIYGRVRVFLTHA